MTKPLFDKIEIGMVSDLGSYTFDREEIIRFAEKFDPQRFHVDEQAAKQSHFGALCASGWHTLSIWMRCNVANGREEIARLTDSEIQEEAFGLSPGVRKIRWLLPVFPGDTITYRSTVTGKRKTPKRPGWGMVMNQSEGFNQHGQMVMSMEGTVTMRTDV